jgi:hypothetical protein
MESRRRGKPRRRFFYAFYAAGMAAAVHRVQVPTAAPRFSDWVRVSLFFSLNGTCKRKREPPSPSKPLQLGLRAVTSLPGRVIPRNVNPFATPDGAALFPFQGTLI